MDILSIFGERLGELIFDNESTADILSKAVGIDVSVVRKYLRRETLPTLKNAVAIADYFGCSLDFLFGLTDLLGGIKKKNVPPFSESFAKLLNDKGISRYRLCKETGISGQRVDDWFNGARLPTMESVIKLTKYFDCSIDYLIGRE